MFWTIVDKFGGKLGLCTLKLGITIAKLGISKIAISPNSVPLFGYFFGFAGSYARIFFLFSLKKPLLPGAP